MNLSRVEKGYDPANALAFQLVLPPEYATERKAATIESLIAALQARPEVQMAGFAYAGILLGLEDTVGTFTPPGRTLEEMRGGHAQTAAEVAEPRLSQGDGRDAGQRAVTSTAATMPRRRWRRS